MDQVSTRYYEYVTEEEDPSDGGEEGEGREQAESERRTDDPAVTVSTERRPRRPEARPRDGPREEPREPGRRGEAPREQRGPEGRRARAEDTASEVSTAKTDELREMLGARGKGEGDRNKPSLSQVRIEPFKGSRSHYKEWKRTLEAQRALYRLEDGELAMLIYLSCQGRAEGHPVTNGSVRDEGTRRPPTSASSFGRILWCPLGRGI